ncbi:MAG: LamG-like jellyroll fold domain-containing protein [Bryobacteraceae bacterium]
MPPLTRETAIALKIPVIFLIIAAAAIPVELRPWGRATLGFSIGTGDVLANVAAFIVLGVVLADLGFRKSVLVGALISTLAEAGQFFMAYRDPSAIDVISNVTGTIIGAYISSRWDLRLPEIAVGKWRATLAAVGALALLAGFWASAGDTINPRGATSPGTIEATWKLDEAEGRLALDSSGHNLNGVFHNQPQRVTGVRGRTVVLDGAKDYIDFSHSPAFRLKGSMTITAWINSTFFPQDDAAIVSQFKNQIGYQLDTTTDKQLRGIGFKLTSSCGNLMARYGATPLVTGIWYHVAGVYDAEARTVDVYLNGAPDNGVLIGPVTGTQRTSRSSLYVGRRSDLDGFNFAGAIDDVRIYSFALTKDEVAADKLGQVIQRTPQPKLNDAPICGTLSEYEDSKIPAAAASLGVLIALAGAGLWPSGRLYACLFPSFAAGLLLLPLMPSSLPPLTAWLMPLVSLAGGASVAVSLRG